jgi:hypothetical protein
MRLDNEQYGPSQDRRVFTDDVRTGTKLLVRRGSGILNSATSPESLVFHRVDRRGDNQYRSH